MADRAADGIARIDPIVALRAGVLAGLVGGLPFGYAMRQMGMLPSVAALVRAQGPEMGMLVHLAVAMTIGAGFGLLMRRQRCNVAEIVYWGLTYGALWWLLGALSLMPLLTSGALAWDLPSARSAIPSLLGHLVYGAVTALVWVLLVKGQKAFPVGSHHGISSMFRGAISGLLSLTIIGLLVGSAGGVSRPTQTLLEALPGPDLPPIVWLAGIALLAGMVYSALEGEPAPSVGLALPRGLAFGFLGWLLLRMSLLPFTAGVGLTWSAAAAASAVPDLIGALLFGALLGALHTGLSQGMSFLFEDAAPSWDQAGFGLGTGGPQVLLQGFIAGLAGGLLFAYVMVRSGALVDVARLIGAGSPAIGLSLHLVISAGVGAGYATIYRRLSYGAGSALAWGLVYGVLWWLVGPLTAMPLLLGSVPAWSASATAGLTASLFGHLAYGAGLGLTFHAISLRYVPWWVPRSRVEANRLAARRAQLFSSAPALWSFILLIAVFIPLVLGG